MHRGRTLGERRLRLEHRGQLVVVDVNQVARLRQHVLGLGDDQRDRLAPESHPVGGQDLHAGLQRGHLDGLTRHVDPDDVVRHVLAEQHRDHPRHRERRAGVPRGDARRRHRRAHQPGVQHAGEGQVARVPGAARHLLRLVVPRQRLPHDPQLVFL
jgi:hypothetical protein